MLADQVRHWFEINRPLMLFVYGQVLFVMGIAILFQTRRYSRLALARSMPWLAAFGILQGFYEWGNFFLPLQAPYTHASALTALEAIQVFLLAASFASLFQFGVTLSAPFPKGWEWVRKLPFIVWLAWVTIPFYLDLALRQDVSEWKWIAETTARYFMGFPGAVMAAWGLRKQAKLRLLPLELPTIYNLLRIAGASLLAYGVLAGLVVSPPHFPFSLMDALTFQRLFILPVEAYQTAVVLVLSVAVILGLEVFEFETDRLIERMEQAQVAAIERERIARDLHDGAIQKVYAAGLVAQALRNKVDDEEIAADLDRLMDGINEAIAELRHFLKDLSEEPETLDLAGALERLVDEARRISGTEIYLETEGEIPSLSPEATTHILSFTREALSNAIRHARSPLIEVRLRRIKDENSDLLKLEIQDHGVGLPNPVDPGYGLRNMQDRAHLLGGKFKLNSSRSGTLVTLEVPLGEEWEVV